MSGSENGNIHKIADLSGGINDKPLQARGFLGHPIFKAKPYSAEPVFTIPLFGHSQTSNIESLLGWHSILTCLHKSTLMAVIFGCIQVHVRKPILPNNPVLQKK